MFCRKCGKQIPDDSNVCMHCGCPVENVPQDAQVGVSKKKNNNKLIVIIVAVVLAVAVAIVGIVTGVMIGKNGNENPSAGKENTEVVNPTDGEKTEEGTKASTAEQTEKPKPAYLEATQKDLDFLNEIFSESCVWTDKYTPESATAQKNVGDILMDLFSRAYYLCAEEYGWSEPETVETYDKALDPKGIYNGEEYSGHRVFPAENVKWLAKNMFGVELTEKESWYRDTYPDGTKIEQCTWYYHEGQYYAYFLATGADYITYTEIDKAIRSDDGKYKISATLYGRELGDEENISVDGRFEIVAGLKEVDGKRVWCFEKWYKI